MAAMIVNYRSLLPGLMWAACAALAIGCQPAPNAPEQQSRQMTVTVNAPQADPHSDPAARPEQIESALHSDPCAARLQDIGGALLEYYFLHGRLPMTLEELSALPDLERPLTFSCPGSDKAFVYVPAGLVSAGDPRPIVVYDPTVDRAGLRWVIRLRRPTHREAAAAFVEHIPQSVFQTATPPAQ